MSFIGNVPAEAYSTVAKDTFSGNGSTTDFTLSLSATTNGVEVFVENVQQEPTTAYTISGTTLSFTAAPTSGTNNIYVIHRGPAVQTVVPPAGVVIDASSVTASGNLSVTGTSTLTGNVTASGDVSIADKIVHTGDTNTAIRFPAADTVTVETGGSERVRVDSSGNITVESSGTATPTYDYSTLGEGLHFRYWDQSGARHADIVATGNTPAGATQDIRFLRNSGGSPGTATEQMRLDIRGFFGVSNNGTYGSSFTSQNSHYIHSTIDDTVLRVNATNASFASAGALINVTRSATSGYRLLDTYSGDYADKEHELRGDGNAYADGSWNGGGADYAEYFEWSDGNLDEEDRRGYSVVLDGDKIRKATDSDSTSDIIGVISGNPSVVGDTDIGRWKQKYLRDDFGAYVLDEDGYRTANPDYDEEQEYISREDRPEWDTVGLMGKLRIRKGQPVGDRWIKMRDISDSVEEWLVR